MGKTKRKTVSPLMKENSKTRRIVEDDVDEVDETDSVSPVEPMSDLIADLKKFIQVENKKTSKDLAEEIRKTDDERMNAIETSLSFALETNETLAKRLKEVETRADKAEKQLYDCAKRICDMEEQLDEMQQRNLKNWLVFSGPAIPRRANAGNSEDPAQILYSMLRQYMDFTLNMEQVEEVRREQRQIRVRFNTVDAGSDRHFLIRNKTRLRGSGLYIRECLTPFRQGIYQELMQLKRTNHISTVFTRDGISFVVVDQHSRPRPIRSLAALERLTQTLDETGSYSQARSSERQLPRGDSAGVDAPLDRDGAARAAESGQRSQRQVTPAASDRQTRLMQCRQCRCGTTATSTVAPARSGRHLVTVTAALISGRPPTDWGRRDGRLRLSSGRMDRGWRRSSSRLDCGLWLSGDRRGRRWQLGDFGHLSGRCGGPGLRSGLRRRSSRLGRGRSHSGRLSSSDAAGRRRADDTSCRRHLTTLSGEGLAGISVNTGRSLLNIIRVIEGGL